MDATSTLVTRQGLLSLRLLGGGGGLVGVGGYRNITHLIWASRWMFNSREGHASCRYATTCH